MASIPVLISLSSFGAAEVGRHVDACTSGIHCHQGHAPFEQLLQHFSFC